MSTRLTSVTDKYLIPKVVDTVLGSNVLTRKMLSRAKMWSGEKIRKSFAHSKNDQGGSFSGLETHSTTAVATRLTLEFAAKFYEIPVVVPLTELSTNRTDKNKIIDLAAAELEWAALSAADDIGTMFYGDGTGNGSKDFMGLEAIVDDSTNVDSYGGHSRTTYTTLKSTVTASGGTLTLDKMATLYNAISDGAVSPTLGLCSPTVFSYYEKLLNPQERIAKEVKDMKGGLVAGSGFTGLFYKGFPILADRKATSGVLYFVNEDFLEWRALPMAGKKPVNYGVKDYEGNDYINGVKGLGFSWSDWIIPTNQASLIGHLYLGGELWSSNPKRHGKLTGITGA